MGSIPTRRIYIRKAATVAGGNDRRPPTGGAASEDEKRAADRLAEALRQRGRAVAVEPVRVRVAERSNLALHALLAIGGGLIALELPLIGATICLIVAFSFYAERALGTPLIGRLLPTRTSQNVISPPPGPAWDDVEIILSAGYDIERSYPVGEWLSRRFSGRLTTDRIVFWGGMVPVFLAAMLNVAELEGTGAQLLQFLASAVLAAMIAAQVDGHFADDPEADDADLNATSDLLDTLDQLLEEPDADPPVAVCFFGADTRSAAGAGAFFTPSRSPVSGNPAAINFMSAAGEGVLGRSKPLLTAREGDLATLRMSDDLASDSPLEPEPSILRRTSPALIARRRGLRATTVVGRGEPTVDLALDLVERVFEENDD